jgi:hypothetical protein
MNGRVLKLGALGVLAVNLFFRGFGKSKIQNQTSKIIPRVADGRAYPVASRRDSHSPVEYPR